jgi:DNA polymerase-1
MVMAYLLQLEEQGLKALSARHCGMRMSSYDDVMGDVDDRRARDYLTWIWDAEQADYETAQQKEFDIQRAFGRRIKKLPTLPKSPLHKAATRVLRSEHPRRLWGEQIEDVQVAGYTRLGPLPAASLDDVPADVAVSYGCRDADATTRLLPELSHRIDALGLRPVYDLELGTYPLIDRMQQIGIQPDLAHFATLSHRLDQEIGDLQSRLCRDTGQPLFNANSGDQVADWLFGNCGLEEIKWTKGGRGSTNDKILEALEHEHPEVPSLGIIRQYREFYKLKHTFVDRLPDFVHRWPHDGRVHATFRTTRVVTGRLAASDPNILAQPEHGKFAKDFKRGWVAAPGHVLCAWDESQVELRGLAHLSQDPVMLAVYRGERKNRDGSPVDLHAALAERIFGVKPALQDKSKHRLPAKAINFGIPMGMTCHGLSVELRKNGVDADEDTAQRWLDETLALYAGVRRYMEERKAEARRCGFVRCLSGRIRYIGGCRSRDDRTREEAERFAFSTPIQESASWIMKRAEAIIWKDIILPYRKRGLYVEPLLQVHDCLKLEVTEGLQDEIHMQMCEAMTTKANGFSVPLEVVGEWGLNMQDMVPFVESR